MAPSTPSSQRLPGILHATPNPQRPPSAQGRDEVLQATGHAGLQSFAYAVRGPKVKSPPRPLPVCLSSVPSPSPPGAQVPRPRREPRRRGPLPYTRGPPPPPSVLIVGSSMVRHTALPGAETCCYPGAKVSDINAIITPLITNHNEVSSVVIHVGSNDIKRQQSELLQEDFKALITTVRATGKTCIISGPFPSPQYGDERYSRIRDLHIWLKRHCCQHMIPFVDNFSAFWNRRELFARDGLHPSRLGAHLLSVSMQLALKSSTA